MGNEKIENRVILSLDDYLELRDKKYESNKNIEELLNVIYTATELNRDKMDLKIDSYYLKGERIRLLIKEIDPERYQKRLDILKLEGDEE